MGQTSLITTLLYLFLFYKPVVYIQVSLPPCKTWITETKDPLDAQLYTFFSLYIGVVIPFSLSQILTHRWSLRSFYSFFALSAHTLFVLIHFNMVQFIYLLILVFSSNCVRSMPIIGEKGSSLYFSRRINLCRPTGQ